MRIYTPKQPRRPGPRTIMFEYKATLTLAQVRQAFAAVGVEKPTDEQIDAYLDSIEETFAEEVIENMDGGEQPWHLQALRAALGPDVQWRTDPV